MLFGSAAGMACDNSWINCELLHVQNFFRFFSLFASQIFMAFESEGHWTFIWQLIMILTILLSTAAIFVVQLMPLFHLTVICTYCYAAILNLYLLVGSPREIVAEALQTMIPTPIATLILSGTSRHQTGAGGYREIASLPLID